MSSILFALTALFFVSPAAEAALIFRGDFESGSTSQWRTQAAAGGISVVSSPVREGRHAARFVVRDGAQAAGGERAEVWRPTDEFEGDESWWAWSTLFPSGYTPTQGHNIFTQWHHQGPRCSPTNRFYINTGRNPDYLSVTARGGPLNEDSCSFPHARDWDLVPLEKDRWYDFIFHVKWSADPSVGFYEIWVNGELVLPLTNAATLYAGRGAYLKQGYYRSHDASGTTTIYHDATRRGQSLADLLSSSTPTPNPGPGTPPPPPPSPPTPEPPPPVSEFAIAATAPADGETVSGLVPWTATTSGAKVARVEFLVDGEYRWRERYVPYVFNGDRGSSWDTRLESEGPHRLTLRATATDGRVATAELTVTVANAAGLEPPVGGGEFEVAATAPAEGATVSGRVLWTATASGAKVARIEFLVDGERRWTERYVPYVFNGDRSSWDTRLESDGPHLLTLRATAKDGRVATAELTVTVANATTLEGAVLAPDLAVEVPPALDFLAPPDLLGTGAGNGAPLEAASAGQSVIVVAPEDAIAPEPVTDAGTGDPEAGAAPGVPTP